MRTTSRLPILFLIGVNLLVGFFTFRSYGLSWDEPLFYDYARALPYAYSPREWLSGSFDLENAFGASGSDHANRGPAYILLAHPVVSLLERLDIDPASAWHLVNFLTFQLGVYLFYLLASRWMQPIPALLSTVLFSWQPLLWGHAFINPKDPPFMVFFIGAVYFGFELIDAVKGAQIPMSRPILLAAFFLGMATSIRVLGPLAGLLTVIYALGKLNKDNLKRFASVLMMYAAASLAVCFLTWPYLWANPINRFIEVFGFMSSNPTSLPVLFAGSIFPADELPRRYFPILLSLTLTEPVYLLTILGTAIGLWKQEKGRQLELAAIGLWFLVPLLYVVVKRPPMYDGYRHFLFCLPPLFFLAGIGLNELYQRISSQRIFGLIALIALLPGLIGAARLHPYEYAYYNSFIGGTSGAFREFETDYWLTCYKEAVENFTVPNVNLFVKREAYIADYYSQNGIVIRDLRTDNTAPASGDYGLVNTRSNEDLKFMKDAPTVQVVKRGSAEFCVIKQVP